MKMELTDEILKKVIQKRKSRTHKGTYGRVLLVGGNKNYGGAIILSASACVNSGAGLVSVACDVHNHTSLHSRLPEAMVMDYMNLDEVKEAIHTSNVISIGSGLGLDNVARTLLTLVLTEMRDEQLVIIDGSAITLVAEMKPVIEFPQNIIYTPHEMEWQRLSGIEIEEQTVENSRNAAHKLNSFVVAKSNETKIFQPELDEFAKVTIGTPAMATGGMGDTLAGLIAGFLAQFHENIFDAISAATYLHSKIARDLSETHYVVLPSMIIHEISQTMKKFEQ
jgi:hydroxyethylthiazole kinase-like uncharacterized protein yjeF